MPTWSLGRAASGVSRRPPASSPYGSWAHKNGSRVVHGTPSGLPIPDAQSPDSSPATPGATEKRRQAHQSTNSDVDVVGGHRDDEWDPECPGPSMPFVPLAALMFLSGDVFDGHRQQDNPTSVPLLRPHAGGRLSPPPLWFAHGGSAFDRACKAVRGREEWAMGNAMHAARTQCEVLHVGKYSNPSFGPFSQVVGSVPRFLWLSKHLGCGMFELSTISP